MLCARKESGINYKKDVTAARQHIPDSEACRMGDSGKCSTSFPCSFYFLCVGSIIKVEMIQPLPAAKTSMIAIIFSRLSKYYFLQIYYL